MNYTFKVYSDREELKLAAKIALKNRLYVNGWCLNKDLNDIKERPMPSEKISLAFDKNNTPVGICLKSGDHVQVFVRKSQRRLGIGKKMVSMLKDENSYGMIGLKKGQSRKFFESVGVGFKSF